MVDETPPAACPLPPAEAREVTGMIRRLAAIVLMQPELDANCQAICENAYPWGQADAAEASADLCKRDRTTARVRRSAG